MANVFQLDHILLPRFLQQPKLPSASALVLVLAPASVLVLAPLVQVQWLAVGVSQRL